MKIVVADKPGRHPEMSSALVDKGWELRHRSVRGWNEDSKLNVHNIELFFSSPCSTLFIKQAILKETSEVGEARLRKDLRGFQKTFC